MLERRSPLNASGDEIVIESITADHIRLYLAQVMKKSSRATAQRRLFAIKAFFGHLEKVSGIPNPAAMMRSPKIDKRLPSFLSEKDAEVLLEDPVTDGDAASARNHAMLEVLYSSGLRVSELTALNWINVDEEVGMITVRAGKGNKDRLVPVGEPALDALRRWRSMMPVPSGPNGPVFTNLRGKRITTRSVEMILAKTLERSGVGTRISPRHPGDARAFESRHDTALHSRQHQPAQGSARASPSARLISVEPRPLEVFWIRRTK